ncbi:MAG TPA: methylated-DNA--[protein]-cysteine S-methyltransferase [Chryseosolibacter sp.]|nr:methylated-DNA--[protein]-cysteine S-methyltransferase [Chryseosolibacter sp.]
MEGRAYWNSPVGPLVIESRGDAITAVGFLKTEKLESFPSPVVDQCLTELDEYFFKGRKFFNIELQFQGSEFQKRVWSELQNIPYGRTISYQELATRLGDPNLVRAVGLANGQNPIAIVVPCHRVIGANGDLVGYGGGLDKKEWLLNHEGAFAQQLKLF